MACPSGSRTTFIAASRVTTCEANVCRGRRRFRDGARPLSERRRSGGGQEGSVGTQVRPGSARDSFGRLGAGLGGRRPRSAQREARRELVRHAGTRPGPPLLRPGALHRAIARRQPLRDRRRSPAAYKTNPLGRHCRSPSATLAGAHISPWPRCWRSVRSYVTAAAHAASSGTEATSNEKREARRCSSRRRRRHSRARSSRTGTRGSEIAETAVDGEG